MPSDIIDQYCDPKGRYVLLNVELMSNVYCILNIYALNDKKSRKIFFDDISERLAEKCQGVKILGGDFNDILNKSDRLSNSVPNQPLCEFN